MPGKIQRWLRGISTWLPTREALPPDLAISFEEFKDIKSIDRIQVASWIGVVLTICLFGLDYYRKFIEKIFDESPHFLLLFYFHVSMLLFLFPAIYTTRHKPIIIRSKLRRGIVIWSTVVICFVSIFGQAIVIYLHRDSLTMFMGFIFTASWMFAMSHLERITFFSVALGIMMGVILNSGNLVMEDQIVKSIEVIFLSAVAFSFDSFDYNLKATNFLSELQINKEQERIIQLEKFKSRFYTNLTHEFRTPLTMISGMADEILEDPQRWAVSGAKTIRQNSDQVLQLINQMLDLSKLESGNLSVRMVQGDVVPFLGYIVDSYKHHAMSRGITIHFLCQEASIVMDHDPEKLKTILGNLISNATKFSPNHGNIFVLLTRHQDPVRDYLSIIVQDQGIGIAKEEQEHIFERFFQGNTDQSRAGTGTGVGLALAKELVEMLNGRIQVNSTPGRGAQFTVELPIYLSASATQHARTIPLDNATWEALVPKDEATLALSTEDSPELLIIEDNKDVQRYIAICLQDSYRLTFTANGEEGIYHAIQNVPDLVLCDVVMPLKDGLSVTRELKQNEATSHIPIILLSAKSDPASRTTGLESGADVYMVKPFEKKELRAQIRALLDRVQKYHERYSVPKQLVEPELAGPISPEDDFMSKVRNIVFANLDNSDFAVHDLERTVFLSRSQLHKKLKALTGRSAMQYVNSIRLSVAREKLKKETVTIADIAYQVGYTDPNYFSRAYADEFGETPTQTRNHHKSSQI